MLKGFEKVNLLTEFKDIKNIELLNSYFEINKWYLIKKNDKEDNQNYYQVYFGKNVQIDNHLEYGFSYAYDEKQTRAELKRLTNFIIKNKKINSKVKYHEKQER